VPDPTRAQHVDVIMPALDEAAALPLVLPHMPAGYHAIVVDNGSTDGTADVARSLGASVVVQPQRGFGAACWAGLTAATADVVAFMDADASFDPRDLPAVCEPVLRGEADLMLGARDAERGAWPFHARVANRVVAGELRRRTTVAITDLGPMRAVRRTELLALGLTDRRSGWPLEMIVLAHRAGWRIRETRVPYRPRTGRSKVTGTVRGTFRAVQDMGRILART
jgi:glycosyltransferase involved in cell wall biosynthesis